MTTTEIVKGSHITGEARAQLAAELRQKYEAGAAIRELAVESGRSFGFVNTLLKESGATIRSRGGANRKV